MRSPAELERPHRAFACLRSHLVGRAGYEVIDALCQLLRWVAALPTNDEFGHLLRTARQLLQAAGESRRGVNPDHPFSDN